MQEPAHIYPFKSHTGPQPGINLKTKTFVQEYSGFHPFCANPNTFLLGDTELGPWRKPRCPTSCQAACHPAWHAHGSSQAPGGAHLDEHEHQHRYKVVSSGHRVLVGQAQQVHDGGAHAQDTLHLVARRLVRTDGPDLRLRRRPRRLPQVDLHQDNRSRIQQLSPRAGRGFPSSVPSAPSKMEAF